MSAEGGSAVVVGVVNEIGEVGTIVGMVTGRADGSNSEGDGEVCAAKDITSLR